jgi:c-di-GMP-binding flagellar brake protein YcgR
MKPCHPAVQISHQKAHSLLDRRYAERVVFRGRITYSGEEGARIVTGEGVLKDLSKTGCKILGTTTSSLGASLALHLHLGDGQAPLRITDAIISGIGKDTFSVRFPSLSPADRKRLQDIV